MLSVKEPRVMWAWVCPITGAVLDESWAATEDYARRQTAAKWGKRRMEMGEMCAVKVTVELLSPEEAEQQRAEFAAWKAKRAKAETGGTP